MHAAALDEAFERRADVRRRFVISAVVWGVGLLLEATIRIPLVYALPIDAMVGLSEALLWATIGALMAWNLVYTRSVWRDLETRDGAGGSGTALTTATDVRRLSLGRGRAGPAESGS